MGVCVCVCVYLGRGERHRREQGLVCVLAEGTQGVTVKR